MSLTFNEIRPRLEEICERLNSEGVAPDLVAFVGNKTENIGEYFAEAFGCKAIFLPSLGIRTVKPYFKPINKVLSYFPEKTLQPFAEIYKTFIEKANITLLEDFTLQNSLNLAVSSAVLLVDDSTVTGRTMEFWKKELGKVTTKPVYTFSVTTPGDYKPDYSCIRGWRSFKWRPTGI